MIHFFSLYNEALILKNPKQLYENNNKTIDEIWSLTATSTIINDDPVVCVSINLFNLKVEKYPSFSLFINDTALPAPPTGFLVYASSPFQFNPSNENNNNFDMITSQTQKMMTIRMDQIERKSTRKYQCDESNQAKYAICIESFITKELQCRPTWFQTIGNKMALCNDSEKYQKFLALIKDLSKANCLVPNCKQKIWKSDEIWTSQMPIQYADTPVTIIQYYSLTKTVKVSKEVFTYQVIDIFNDFAGVLSLCLGVSIISFYDYIVDTSKKIYIKCKNFFNAPDPEPE